MTSGPQPGFPRPELKSRYDVDSIREDEWHTYSGEITNKIIQAQLTAASLKTHRRLLNAGCGIYRLDLQNWSEVRLDLFDLPIKESHLSVCGSVEYLPFCRDSFGAVVCVGEVLGYCDPAAALREFARVLAPSGILISDFGSSKSIRRLLTRSFGRAADLITDDYNGSPERTWVYDPSYIRALFVASGFKVQKVFGTHTWSALVRRLGCSRSFSVSVQRRLEWLPLPLRTADLITVVAARD